MLILAALLLLGPLQPDLISNSLISLVRHICLLRSIAIESRVEGLKFRVEG